MSTSKKARNQENNSYQPSNGFKAVKPLNYIQTTYLEAIHANNIVFGVGSAGTGKTFISANYAAEQLFYKKISKIILTRPTVEIGPSIGFLPGTLEEKYAPYLAPFQSIFEKALGKGFYEYALKNRDIEPIPIGFMRGSTYENCVILIDECQNMTKAEFKMLLSRIGKNCKMIFSGDPDQSDIEGSGLDDAITRLARIAGIDIVYFQPHDIVRSNLCKQIILAYNN